MENKMKRLDKNVVKLGYNIVLKRINKLTGEVIDEETIHNTVVNVGLNMVRDFLGDSAGSAPKYMAVGTGDTGEQATDTSLETEVTRELATIDIATNYICTYTKTFTFGGSYAITELGMFDSATASGSSMFNRATFAAKNVSTEIDLRATVNITIADA